MRDGFGPRAAWAIAGALGFFAMATSNADPQPRLDTPDERGIDVQVQSCARLDVARLRALFALEVRTVVDRLGPVTLVVRCTDDRTSLWVESPTRGTAERSIPAALARAEEERLLALAAAQLVFAVWLDVQPQDRAPQVDSALPEPPAITPAAPVSAQVQQPQKSFLDIGLEVGARARVLGELTVGPNAALSATAWRQRWGAELSFSFDRTSVARPLGSAELVAGELGLAAAWRSSFESPLALEIHAGPALAVLDLRGVDPVAHVAARSVAGLTLDTRVAAAVRYRRAGLWALARFEAGYLVSGPEGTIAGESSIETRGPWTGASLGVGGAW